MSNYQKKKERTRSNLRVFGGNSHPSLTKSIARKVGVQVGEVKATKFANNETNVDLKENVRGQVSIRFWKMINHFTVINLIE